VATDSIYGQNTALYKLEGVEAFVASQVCNCGQDMCVSCLLKIEVLPTVALAQWRDKGERL